MIKAAVLGYGNIGSGVVAVLLKSKEVIEKQIGEAIVPVRVLDLREFPGDIMEKNVVKDIALIVNDPEITLVVETMGGVNPAYSFVKSCLEAGKHVATSNKELVAAHGPELLAIAKEHNVNFMFEASVGGAIPIIRPLSVCMTGDKITEITGILNGTTNFMLTSMAEQGAAYADVLERAQELGYAERNPAADVEGHDACRKIAILTSMALGKWVDYKDIPTEGITKITDTDMAYAKKLGCAIKLFGTSHIGEEAVYARVSPVMINKNHPLFAVNGVMNAVLVRGELMGDLMYYGSGAGKLPTASAVVADLVAAVKHPNGGEVRAYSSEKQTLSDGANEVCSWFVRIAGSYDERTAAAYGAQQTLYLEEEAAPQKEFAVITVPMSEAELEKIAAFYPYLGKIRIAE